jgi:hypothetical protein
MPCPNHTAALDVVAAAEAALRDDQEGLKIILDHADLRAMASMGASMLATLASVTGDAETVLGRFRAVFSESHQP